MTIRFITYNTYNFLIPRHHLYTFDFLDMAQLQTKFNCHNR